MNPETSPEPSFQSGFPVSIILAYPKGRGDFHPAGPGEVVGVVAGGPLQRDTRKSLIHSGTEGEQYLWSGFRLDVHKDDAESYYCNLMGDNPSVFVICRGEEEQPLQPFLVTLSYDEAASYLEVDDAVSAVAMPPEIYRWLEAFVLSHYVPERKKKRKRDNWKQDPQAR